MVSCVDQHDNVAAMIGHLQMRGTVVACASSAAAQRQEPQDKIVILENLKDGFGEDQARHHTNYPTQSRKCDDAQR
jgi:hypothetical protein